MAKRLNGEGSLRRRADGRWEYRLMDGYLEDGRPNTVSFYGRTQKEVRDKLENYRIRHIYGIDTRVKHTFATWSEIWFQNHQDNISPTTRENYKYILTTLKARLGSRKLDGIKAFDIEQLLKELRREGRSDSYLASCRGMLYQIFNKAEANDLILKNPVRFADKMRSSRTAPKRKDAFHAEEVRRMMEQLPHDLLGESIRLMLGTGMRTQELLALEPRHIAQDGSMISIRQAVNLVKGTVSVGPPKSRDSYRDIPVPPSLRPCAMAIRNTEKKYIWEVGVKDQPCNPSHFRKKFREALKQIGGVRLLTPHCCRHTYVSQMQALGVDLPTIQSIVGHADLDMTQHYLHVQDSIRQAVNNLFFCQLSECIIFRNVLCCQMPAGTRKQQYQSRSKGNFHNCLSIKKSSLKFTKKTRSTPLVIAV